VSGVILASALIRIGWRLQCETSEQGKPREASKNAGGTACVAGWGSWGGNCPGFHFCALALALPCLFLGILKSANGDGFAQVGWVDGVATLVASCAAPFGGRVILLVPRAEH
jgi:hypothetical protein